MKPISTPMGKRGKGSIRKLSQVATLVALGGLILVARSRGVPPGAATAWPLWPGPVAGTPGLMIWEGRARSFDRCLVPLASGTMDPGFVVQAPAVDPGMVVPSAVIGLPVGPANR